MRKIRILTVLWLVLLVGGLVVPAYASEIGTGFGTEQGEEEDTARLFTGIGTLIDGTDDPTEVVSALQILALFSVIALAPTLLLMMTGFTRILIMFSFLRNAMATQQMPPNQVMVGIALVLTILIMQPVFTEINENAITPFGAGEIDTEETIERITQSLRGFMISQMRDADNEIGLFASLAGEDPESPEDASNAVLISAFILSELTQAFLFGFLIYIPFIVIDMVVASILLSMGMMMLPPAMISLPFKIMTFLLAGGWSWIVEGIMLTFE